MEQGWPAQNPAFYDFEPQVFRNNGALYNQHLGPREKMKESDDAKVQRMFELNKEWEVIVEILRASCNKAPAENRARYSEYIETLQARKADLIDIFAELISSMSNGPWQQDSEQGKDRIERPPAKEGE
jgi:hypothetical protein